MKKFPELTTKRLVLKKVQVKDIPQIVEYAGDKRIAEMTINLPHPYAEKDAIFWINMANEGFASGSKYIFGIRLKPDEAFIGGMGLHINKDFNRAVLGYWIAVPFWNEGLATEAAGAVLDFGFNVLNINKIYATHLVQNPASGKVMIKNGMIKEGVLKDHTKKGDVYGSVVQYRLTKAEYNKLT